MKVRTIARQTLTDLTARYYGSIEKLFVLWQDNIDKVPQIDSVIPAGTVVTIREAEIVNPNVIRYFENYFRDRALNIATAIPLDIIGPDGDYNDDYNDDYNNQ